MEQSFLNDIMANPNDDQPRLVYADWLEEQGDMRAEFIRVQCELARMPRNDPRRNELEGRELAFIRRRSKGWAKPIRPYAREWTYRRGFVHGVRIDANMFLEHRQELVKLAPVQSIQFHKAWPRFSEIGACQELRQMHSISFANSNLGYGGQDWAPMRVAARHRSDANDQLRDLLNSPYLRQLRELDLNGAYLGDRCLTTMAQAPLPHLAALDLCNNSLSADALAKFSREMTNLRGLRAAHCNLQWMQQTSIFSRAKATFALLPLLNNLTHLDVHHTGGHLRALETIADRAAPRLRSLVFSSNNLQTSSFSSHRAGASVLERVQLLEHLDHLDVTSCELTSDAFAPLLQSGRLNSLQSLAISNNPFYYYGAERLATCGQLNGLRHLRINGGRRIYSQSKPYQLQNRGFSAIISSEKLPRLALMEARRNNLTAASIEALLESPLLPQLYLLDLRDNRIGDKGAKLLAQHGPWDRLAMLNLRQNQISRSARNELLEKFGYRVVV